MHLGDNEYFAYYHVGDSGPALDELRSIPIEGVKSEYNLYNCKIVDEIFNCFDSSDRDEINSKLKEISDRSMSYLTRFSQTKSVGQE